MTPVGARNKGNAFERLICRQLSLWLSEDKATDLFMRNVASGGAFTLSERSTSTRGVPGDIMSVHPLAHDFSQCFLVECKHWRRLDLDSALWKHTGEFYQVIQKAAKQAAQSRRIFLILAKQNNWPIIALMPYKFANLVAKTDWHRHDLWDKTITACLLLDITLKVDPVAFIAKASEHLQQ